MLVLLHLHTATATACMRTKATRSQATHMRNPKPCCKTANVVQLHQLQKNPHSTVIQWSCALAGSSLGGMAAQGAVRKWGEAC